MSTPGDESQVEEETDSLDDAAQLNFDADCAAKRRALLWMPVWFFLPGFATGFWGEGDLFDLIVQIAGAIGFLTLLHRWCAADARLHGQTLWPYFLATLVVCPGPLLVVPIHLIRSRGVKGLLASLLAILYLLLLIVIEIVGFVLGMLVSGRDLIA